MNAREPEGQETVLEYLRRGRKGFYPSAIRTCEGDLFLICDALEDYARICEQYIERERDKLTAYQVGAIECRIERYRHIAGKYADAIGYPQMLDPIIRACLVPVPIKVAEGASCGGTAVETQHTLYRKGFLLSSMEATGQAGWQGEGTAFAYLSGTQANRIAYSDETATAVYWWLRSPSSNNLRVYCVDTSGALDYGSVHYADNRCPRPALTLSSEIFVSDAPGSDGCYTVESAPAGEQYMKQNGIWLKMV